MTKEQVLPLLCFVDNKFRKRVGPNGQIYLDESIRSASKILEEADITLKIIAAIRWPLPVFKVNRLRKKWRRHKNRLCEYYSGLYDEEQIKGIFIMDTALKHLLNLKMNRKDVCHLTDKCITIGFIGALYYFDSFNNKNRQLFEGGGLAYTLDRCCIINYHPNQYRFVRTIVHELLHLFGISHAEKGIMATNYDYYCNECIEESFHLGPSIIDRLKIHDLLIKNP